MPTQHLYLNVRELRALLNKTALDIRTVKSKLRQTWTRPMHSEQSLLHGLKRNATLLCILRAYGRGKYHLSHPPGTHPAPEDWNQEKFHRERALFAVDKFRLHGRPIPVTSTTNEVITQERE